MREHSWDERAPSAHLPVVFDSVGAATTVRPAQRCAFYTGAACRYGPVETEGDSPMTIYEYKVIPAPRRGEKAKGAKTTADRFAHALTVVMNDLARDGWEYLRADTLPCDERVGLTGKTTAFQNMLVFRRATTVAAPAPRAEAPAPMPMTAIAPEGAPPRLPAPNDPPPAAPSLGAARNDGVAAE